MKKKNYKEKLPNINAFIFDVDGVLTDGKVTVTPEGGMFREMHTKDGFALKFALTKGYKIAIISGGTNKGVKKRLNALGIEDVYLGAENKQKSFDDFLIKYNLKKKEILYMGDDIPDIKIMNQVGVSSCPNDASIDVKAISDYISHIKGGNGCVREILEQVLRSQKKWY